MSEVVGADPFRQPDWWLSASAGFGPNRPEARPWQRTYASQKELLMTLLGAGDKEQSRQPACSKRIAFAVPRKAGESHFDLEPKKTKSGPNGLFWGEQLLSTHSESLVEKP